MRPFLWIAVALLVASGERAWAQQQPSFPQAPAQEQQWQQPSQPQTTQQQWQQPAQQQQWQQPSQPQATQQPWPAQPATGAWTQDPWATGQQSRAQQPPTSPYPAQQQYPAQQYPPQQPWATDPTQPPVAVPGPAPPSALGARQSPQSYTADHSTAPAAPWVGPQELPGSPPSTAPCTVRVTGDRNAVALLDGTSGTARKYLPLGEDRIQKVLSSPDGTWAIAFAKFRRASQFYAVALDLSRCEDQPPFEVTGVPASVEFQGPDAVLTFGDHQQRVKLRNPIVE